MRDFLQVELKVAQHIAYCVRSGSKMWLCLAMILEVHPDHLRVQRIDPPCERTLTVRNMATVIVVAPAPEASNVADPQ